jgi:hypothetical protein
MFLRNLTNPWDKFALAPEGAAGAGEGAGGAGAGAGAGAGGAGNSGSGAPGEGYVAWRDSLQDPKMKAAAERYHSWDDMLTSNVTLRTEIADRIRLPGPNATPEDITKFRRGLGVPDDAKGYEVKLTEGLTLTDEDKALIDAIRPIAHENNVPAKVFNSVIERLISLGNETSAATEKALKAAADASIAEQKKKWSTDYDKNRELFFRTVNAFGGDQGKAAVESAVIEGFGRLQDWPPFLDLIVAIGKRADEAELHLGSSGGEAQSAQQELDQIVKDNPPGSDGYKAKQARVQELYAIIHGKKPIVGASGRNT